jgi:hypothetical protein
MGRRRCSSVAVIMVAVGVAVALVVAAASGERAQEGNLIVSLSGELSPHDLPRVGTAPVKISLDSAFSTADGSRLPQLRRIAIKFGNRGKLTYRGLPICPEASIRFTALAGALAACRSALVGRGRLEAEVGVPGQRSFPIVAQMLAFNGIGAHGRRLILADVHSEAPPVSLVMRFTVRRGARATVLAASLPAAAGSWARVSRFDLTLQRRFRYRGHWHSFVTAGCSVPVGFTGIVFPLAQATYGFAGGGQVSVATTRGCSVRGAR